jgi:hypothetical protein
VHGRESESDMVITEVGPEDISVVGESLSGASTRSAGTSLEDASTKKPLKPHHSRVILEVDNIDKVFEELGCPKCGGPIKASIRTVCISSSIGFQCIDEDCCFSHARTPSTTTIHLDSKHKTERSTDYAINVLYVLGFISVGDGCTEAARLLGVLGLPNDTTMESRSFTIIEERLVPLVRDLLDEIIRANLIEEVKSTIGDGEQFKTWFNALNDKSIWISDANKPRVEASYDMAWQQKGSGHVYNSMSGHGTFIGRHSRKVIALVMKSKTCGTCVAWKKKHGDELEAPPHQCWKNHEGSSGSMESAGCVELVVELFDKFNVVVAKLCCDDDSSIRADCQWSPMKITSRTTRPMCSQWSPRRLVSTRGSYSRDPTKGSFQDTFQSHGLLPTQIIGGRFFPESSLQWTSPLPTRGSP